MNSGPSDYDRLIYYLSKILGRGWVLSLQVILIGVIALPYELLNNFDKLILGILTGFVLFAISILLISICIVAWQPVKPIREYIYRHWEERTAPFHRERVEKSSRIVEYEVPNYSLVKKRIIRQGKKSIGILIVLWIAVIAADSIGLISDFADITGKDQVNVSYLGGVVSVLLGRVFGIVTLTTVAVFPRLSDGLIIVTILGLISYYAAPFIQNIFVVSEEIIYKSSIEGQRGPNVGILLFSIFLCFLLPAIFWSCLNTL